MILVIVILSICSSCTFVILSYCNTCYELLKTNKRAQNAARTTRFMSKLITLNRQKLITTHREKNII